MRCHPSTNHGKVALVRRMGSKRSIWCHDFKCMRHKCVPARHSLKGLETNRPSEAGTNIARVVTASSCTPLALERIISGDRGSCNTQQVENDTRTSRASLYPTPLLFRPTMLLILSFIISNVGERTDLDPALRNLIALPNPPIIYFSVSTPNQRQS